jgi:hypothetical protein
MSGFLTSEFQVVKILDENIFFHKDSINTLTSNNGGNTQNSSDSTIWCDFSITPKCVDPISTL